MKTKNKLLPKKPDCLKQKTDNRAFSMRKGLKSQKNTRRRTNERQGGGQMSDNDMVFLSGNVPNNRFKKAGGVP